MPIRVVMPNGTTRPFREGTPNSVIAQAKRDMVALMQENDEDHENWRASRRMMAAGVALPRLKEPAPYELHPEPPEIPEAPEPPEAPQVGRYKDVPYLTPEDRAAIHADQHVMEVGSKLAKLGAGVAGAFGQEEFAAPLTVAEHALAFKPLQRLTDDIAIAAINRMREKQVHPTPWDWLLRRIFGDEVADRVNRAGAQQQMNDIRGNNALQAGLRGLR